jgi:hypothetical protein
MGRDCWQHAMSSDTVTAEEIQSKLILETFRNFEKFLFLINAGDHYNAGFELGKSLHYLQDSYSPSHTSRSADGQILAFYDYATQSPVHHEEGDYPSRSTAAYLNAAAQTQNMIQLFLNRSALPDRIAPFYMVAPGIKVGLAGEGLGPPRNTLNPQTLWNAR